MRETLRTAIGLGLVATLAGVAPAASETDPLTPDEIRVMTDAGQNVEAAEEARKLLARAEQQYGEHSLPVAEALELLARALARANQRHVAGKAERLALAERALEIRLDLSDPDDPGLASAYYVVGLVHNLAGDRASAVEPFAHALRIAEAHYGELHPETEIFVREYGTALFGTGRYEEAREIFRRHLAISRAKFEEMHASLVAAVFNLAIVSKTLNDFETAEALYLEALSILEAQQDPDTVRLLRTRISYRSLLAIQGRLAEALAQNQETLRLTREMLGDESYDVALMLNETAAMLRMLGDLDKAKAHLEECLAIQEKIHVDADFALRTRLNLAMLLSAREETEAARRMFESIPPVVGSRLEPTDTLWGEYHTAYGNLLLSMGDLDRARAELQKGIEILESTIGADHIGVADARGWLGRLEVASGSPRAAVVQFQSALSILGLRVGRHHPRSIEVLDGLAETYVALDEDALAFETALEAETAARRLQNETLPVLPERQALAHLRKPHRGRDVALTLALRPDAPAAVREQTYDVVIRSRARVYDELALRQRTLFGSTDPEVLQSAERLREAKTRLANLFLGGDGHDPREYQAGVESARRRAEELETELARVSADYRDRLAQRSFGLGDLRKTLRAGTALVSYVRFERTGGDAEYAAIVQAGPRATPRFVALGGADEIESAVDGWRRQLEPLVVVQEGEEPYRRVAGKLRVLIWDPVARLLGDATEVLVVPDGAVSLVSLSAMPAGETGYLLESGPQFHYLTAERDLSPGEPAETGGGLLLAVGSPAFDKPGARRIEEETVAVRGLACSDQLPRRFEPLAAAEGEVDAVRRIWKEADAGKARVLKGRKASETLLKELAPEAAVLHLATHGFFLDGTQCGTGSGYRGIGGISPGRDDRPSRATGPAINPLLLSGLALAGADRHDEAADGGDDGILTAEEVGTLDLRGVRLAVLSACRTGAGRVEQGEGVFGLRRSFQIAGARVVVTNLWDAEDVSARAWIEEFYRERLLNERTIPRAMRAASRALLDVRRDAGLDSHPFYWAGWLAVGNPG